MKEGEGINRDGDDDEEHVKHGQSDEQLVEAVLAHVLRAEDEDGDRVGSQADQAKAGEENAFAPPLHL